MGKVLIEETNLTNIANAIRNKTGKSDLITPPNMATEIDGIVTGGGFDPLIDGTITGIVTACTSIRDYSFQACKSLLHFRGDLVETINNYAFSNCSNLVDCIVPNAKTIGNYAFRNCGLMEFDGPLVTSIGDYSFNQSSKLKSVNLPLVTTLSNSAFNNCSGLEDIKLDSLTTIKDRVFASCTSLKKVDLPKVTKLGTSYSEVYIFSGCSSLETLILRSTTMCTNTGTSNLQNTPIANGTGYIYVPSSLIDSYKSNSIWKTYANQFRAIEDYPDICG